MFSLLNSWATKNPCLNRGFNFTLSTFLRYFSTALSVRVRDTQQCCVTADAVCRQESLGEPSTRAPGRGVTQAQRRQPPLWKPCNCHGCTVIATKPCVVTCLSYFPFICHLLSRQQPEAAPRSAMPGLSEGSHYIHVMPRRVMCVTEDLACLSEIVLVISVTSWDYNLASELCFKCNFGYFLVSVIFL